MNAHTLNGRHAPADALTIDGLREALVNTVDVRVETYLGSTTMTVAEVNALVEGSVVTLASMLNAPVELRVNDVAIAFGELVSVGDKFGVRVTSVSP